MSTQRASWFQNPIQVVSDMEMMLEMRDVKIEIIQGIADMEMVVKIKND